MKIWNVGDKEIKHFYNSRMIIIKPNSAIDVSDDVGLFMLNRPEVRGLGLVELKEGDNKAECYKKGRKQIYLRATSKYNDYLRHCEEREAQRLQPLAPHTEIIEYKNMIDDYDNWVKEGQPIKEEYQEIVGERKIFVCPHCSLEFNKREDYFGHLPLHNKENGNADIGVVGNTGQGKS